MAIKDNLNHFNTLTETKDQSKSNNVLNNFIQDANYIQPKGNVENIIKVNEESNIKESNQDLQLTGKTKLQYKAKETETFNKLEDNIKKDSQKSSNTFIGYKDAPEAVLVKDYYDETKLAFRVFTKKNDGKNNAFEVYLNGDSRHNGKSTHPGTGYSEMFEWSDGNISNEDRIGRFVTMDGDKIKLADKDSKYILGIISGNPAVIGNEPMEWNKKYINDIWDRPTYTHHEYEIERHKFNSDINKVEKEIVIKKQYTRTVEQKFDETLIYIPRENRKEWGVVGMIGKIIVLQDGTLKVGDFCYPSTDGIASHSEQGFYVMQILNNKQAIVIMK